MMIMPTPEQLLLNVRPRADIRLEDFAAATYGLAVAALRALLEPGATPCYVWGAEDTGRAALFAALAQEADQQGLLVVSLPLAEVLEHGAGVLEGLETAGLLIVDQLDAVAGKADWEEALFHLFNRARGRAGLLFGAAGPARDIGIALPDLVSRLQQSAVFSLPTPDDALRQQVLSASAGRRGLVLTAEVERYLVERGPRTLGGFMDCLERLDQLSLREQRRLTVPFLRQLLGGEPGGTG
jgi:DnaA family protein